MEEQKKTIKDIEEELFNLKITIKVASEDEFLYQFQRIQELEIEKEKIMEEILRNSQQNNNSIISTPNGTNNTKITSYGNNQVDQNMFCNNANNNNNLFGETDTKIIQEQQLLQQQLQQQQQKQEQQMISQQDDEEGDKQNEEKLNNLLELREKLCKEQSKEQIIQIVDSKIDEQLNLSDTRLNRKRKLNESQFSSKSDNQEQSCLKKFACLSIELKDDKIDDNKNNQQNQLSNSNFVNDFDKRCNINDNDSQLLSQYQSSISQDQSQPYISNMNTNQPQNHLPFQNQLINPPSAQNQNLSVFENKYENNNRIENNNNTYILDRHDESQQIKINLSKDEINKQYFIKNTCKISNIEYLEYISQSIDYKVRSAFKFEKPQMRKEIGKEIHSLMANYFINPELFYKRQTLLDNYSYQNYSQNNYNNYNNTNNNTSITNNNFNSNNSTNKDISPQKQALALFAEITKRYLKLRSLDIIGIEQAFCAEGIEKRYDLLAANDKEILIIDWKYTNYDAEGLILFDCKEHFLQQIKVLEKIYPHKEVRICILPLRELESIKFIEFSYQAIQQQQKDQSQNPKFKQGYLKILAEKMFKKQYCLDVKFENQEGINETLRNYVHHMITKNLRDRINYYCDLSNSEILLFKSDNMLSYDILISKDEFKQFYLIHIYLCQQIKQFSIPLDENIQAMVDKTLIQTKNYYGKNKQFNYNYNAYANPSNGNGQWYQNGFYNNNNNMQNIILRQNPYPDSSLFGHDNCQNNQMQNLFQHVNQSSQNPFVNRQYNNNNGYNKNNFYNSF